jgi:hypothetical protein
LLAKWDDPNIPGHADVKFADGDGHEIPFPSIVPSSAHGFSLKWAVDEKMTRAIFWDGHVI